MPPVTPEKLQTTFGAGISVFLATVYSALTVISVALLIGIYFLERDSLGFTSLVVLLVSPVIFIWLIITGSYALPLLLTRKNGLLVYIFIIVFSGIALSVHLSIFGFIIVLIPLAKVLYTHYQTQQLEVLYGKHSAEALAPRQKAETSFLKFIGITIFVVLLNYIYSTFFN
jgi:hypothetical protein